MRLRPALVLLAVAAASAPAAQTVRDSVRMELSIYSFYTNPGTYHNCGAGVLATWPNVLQDALGSESRTYGYSNYSRVATEGMYIPSGYGEADAPEGFLAHNPQLGGSASSPFGCDLAPYIAGAAYRISGASGTLNAREFRVTDWYAVFSIQHSTPIALFEWEQTDGLAVAFDGSFESRQSHEVDADAPGGRVPVSGYEWDFGDGQEGEGPKPTHTYAEPGEYRVRLTVTDDDGEVASREVTVRVFAAHLTVEVVSATEEAAKGDTITVVARVTNTGSEALTDVSVARSFVGVGRAPDEIAHPSGQYRDLSTPAVAVPEGESTTETRARLEPGASFEVTRQYRVERTARYRIYGETAYAPADVIVDWMGAVPVSARPTVSDSAQVRQPCLVQGTRCAATLVLAPRPAELFVSVEGRPNSVPVGATFEIRAVVRNDGEGAADDVHVEGALAITSADGGAARLLSGPEPASLGTLDPAAADTLVWTAEAEAIGTLAFEVTVVGTDETGATVTATPLCAATRQSAGGAPAARTARADCTLEVRPVAFTPESAFMEEDDLAWPDSTVTLRWTAPEASTVEIHASLKRDPDPENDADWPLVVATGLDAATGEMDWAPPQEAVSPTVRLRIRDEAEPSAYGLSERTRVRYGWHLTRVVEDDAGETTYEYFDPARHAWSDNDPDAFDRWRTAADTELLLQVRDGVAGDAVGRTVAMDPAFGLEAWRREAIKFESTEPPPPPSPTAGGRAVMQELPELTQSDYQAALAEGRPRRIDRTGTPSWRSVAFAYGMENTYGAASPVVMTRDDGTEVSHVQPDMPNNYLVITQTGTGMCYGLAWSALLSFQMPEAFAARYGALAPGLGVPETASIPLSDRVIDVIGAAFWTQFRDNRNVRYDDVLFVLSAALLSDDPEDDVVLSSQTHTVLPYRVEVAPSGDVEAVVHNRTYPGTAARGAGSSRFRYDGHFFVGDGEDYWISAEEPSHFFEPVPSQRLSSRTEITAGVGADLRVGEPACEGETLPITAYRNDPDLQPLGVEVPDCPVGFTTRGVEGTASATVTTADGAAYTFSRFGASAAEADSLAYDGDGLVYLGAPASTERRAADARPVALTVTDAAGHRAVVAMFVESGLVSARWADVAGGLRVTTDGGATSYAVLLQRPDGAEPFLSDEIEISPGAVHTFRPTWSDLGTSVALEVDDDGDGSVDRTTTVVDAGPTPGETGPALPDALALDAPFPNPTRGRVTLRVALPEAGPVRVVLYDALGRAVLVAHDGPLAAGRQPLVLDAAALPSGVYVVRLEAGDEVRVRRLTVVR